MRALRTLWRWLREATGDDAYERYLVHQSQVHPGSAPMSRREFVKAEQERKWSGVNRCC